MTFNIWARGRRAAEFNMANFATKSEHKRGMCHESWGCPQKGKVLRKGFDNYDLARKAGHICGENFPWYNGGFPIFNLDFDSEMEDYTCLTVKDRICMEWEVFENSKEEWEYGTCKCTEVFEEHCTFWECDQREGRKCYRDGEWTVGGEWIDHNEAPKSYRCCKQVCPDDSYTCFTKCETPQWDREISKCSCTENEDTICTQWTCQELYLWRYFRRVL